MQFQLTKAQPSSTVAMCDRATYYAIVGWLYHQPIVALMVERGDSLFQGGSLVGYISLTASERGESQPCVFHLEDLERFGVPVQITVQAPHPAESVLLAR